MSLWTPGGEVPIERGGRTAPEPATTPPPELDGFDLDSLSPEERAQAEAFIAEMADAQRRIAATPADALVANHAAGLYDLAAIKLSDAPPQIEEAHLAIDALAALLDGVGDRLGEHAQPLRDALQTIQVAWVQIRDQLEGPPPG
jgi:hypothetical protein